MKKKIIILISIVYISISSLIAYNHRCEVEESNQLTRKILNSKYNPRKMIKTKLEEYKSQKKKEKSNPRKNQRKSRF